MPLTRNVIAQIQRLLAAGGEPDPQTLADLVWNYAEVCRNLNERAQQILDLIRQGRRADALRLAADGLDLKDEISLLDFPERFEWLDRCERAGMPVADILDTAALYRVVQELYNESGALSQLVRLRRRMALGLAPVASQLRVLRQIRANDPDHAYWDEDIRAFEAARVDELRREAERADTRGDLEALEAILADLRSSEWFVPPPVELLRAVERIARPHQNRRIRAHLDQLAAGLAAALEAKNRLATEEALRLWDEALAEGRLAPPADLAPGAEGAREWLRQCRKADEKDAAHRRACQALDDAIRDGADRQTVEGRARVVLTSPGGMPPVLAKRFNEYMEALKARRTKRIALIAGGLAAAVVLAGGAVGAYVVLAQRREALDAAVQQLDDALGRADPGAARAVLAALQRDHPGLLASSDVQGRLARVQALEESSRGFAELARETEQAIEDLEKAVAPPAAPADALDQVRQRQPRLESLLRRAAERAKTADDTARAQALGRRYLRAAAAAAIEELAAVLAGAPDAATAMALARDRQADLEALLARLKAASPSPDDLRQADALAERYARAADKARQGWAAGLQDQLLRLREEYVEVSRGAAAGQPPRDRLAALQDRVRALLAVRDLPDDVRTGARSLEQGAARLLDDQEAAAGALRRIASLVDRPDELARELDAFAAAHPDHPLAPDFRKSAGLAPQWTAAKAWQTAVAGWGAALRLHDLAEIDSRAARLDKFLQDCPGSPYEAAARDYRAYLDAAKTAFAGGQLAHLSSLLEYLNQPFFTTVQVIRAKDGRTFHVTRFREGGGGGVVIYSFDYLLDGLGNTRNGSLTVREIDGGPAPAPQARFHRAASQAIGQFKGPGWETFYLRLAQQALGERELDPILTGKLLKEELLPHAAATTPFKAQDLQQLLAQFNAVDLIDAAWMNPDDPKAGAVRTRIGAVLRTVGSLDPMIQEVERRLAALARAGPTHRMVGLLLGGEAGPVLEAGLPAGPLCVLWAGADGRPRFLRVGAIEAGRAALDPAAAGAYPRGTPLFLGASSAEKGGAAPPGPGTP